MMKDALILWKEIETETNTTLLEKYPILNFGHPSSEFLKGIFSHFPEEKVLSASDIKSLFPAFRNLPEDYIGMLTYEGKYCKLLLSVPMDF